MEFIKTSLDNVAGFSGGKLVEKKFYFSVEPDETGVMADGELFERLVVKLVHLTDEEFAADYMLDPYSPIAPQPFPRIRKKQDNAIHRIIE
jgi:hypothetical protein